MADPIQTTETPDWLAGWNAACEDFASIEEHHAKAYEADGEMAEAALAYMKAKDARGKKR